MDALIARTVEASLAATRAVDDYRGFKADIATVRTAGNAAYVALRRMENTPGDVNLDAYLDALAAGRTAVHVTRKLVAAELAGNPDR